MKYNFFFKKNLMEHTYENAGETFLNALIICTLLVIIQITDIYNIISWRSDMALVLIYFPSQFWLVFFLIKNSFYFSKYILRVIHNNKDWEITLTKEYLKWDAPGYAEESFQINISEIYRIAKVEITIKKYKRKRGSANSKYLEGRDSRGNDKYYIVKNNSERIFLSEESGVSIKELFSVLNNRGIKSSTEYEVEIEYTR